MRSISVLNLGGDPIPRAQLANQGITVAQISSLMVGDIYDGRSACVDTDALKLAEEATPALYDLVVIGHHQSTGLHYTGVMPGEMLDRVLLVWNGDDPNLDSLSESSYRRRHGIKHFSMTVPEDMTRSMIDILSGIPEVEREKRDEIRVHKTYALD